MQELWLELSRCAAMCYKRGGRRRNAALLRLEVRLDVWVHTLSGPGMVLPNVSISLLYKQSTCQHQLACYLSRVFTCRFQESVTIAAQLFVRQVAEALAGRGAVRASVSLLAALAQDALTEGWLSLAAGLLYRLLEVSAPLETVRALLTFHCSCPAGGCMALDLRHLMLLCNHVQPLHNVPSI